MACAQREKAGLNPAIAEQLANGKRPTGMDADAWATALTVMGPTTVNAGSGAINLGMANNFTAAVGEYAGWGYFDFRMKGEGFDEGYQKY